VEGGELSPRTGNAFGRKRITRELFIYLFISNCSDSHDHVPPIFLILKFMSVVEQPEIDTHNLGLAASGTTVTITSPLDLLLSPPPTAINFNDHVAIRESQSDFRDVALDDVPLTARPIKSTAVETSEEYRRRSVDSVSSANFTTTDRQKKSASTSSVHSASNLPFILARLDIQKSHEENSPNPQRASVDGQLKLQEEFVRLQNEKEEEENAPGEAIDWSA
jgi:hypothetical protein